VLRKELIVDFRSINLYNVVSGVSNNSDILTQQQQIPTIWKFPGVKISIKIANFALVLQTFSIFQQEKILLQLGEQIQAISTKIEQMPNHVV
jgi:hypothetical protein